MCLFVRQVFLGPMCAKAGSWDRAVNRRPLQPRPDIPEAGQTLNTKQVNEVLAGAACPEENKQVSGSGDRRRLAGGAL